METETSQLQDTTLQGLRFLESNRGFLGREFLTWLWYRAEVQKHEFAVSGLGTVQIFVDDKLVLSSVSGSVHESCLKGGTPAYAKESRTALFSGKLVQEAKFILHFQDEQWSFTMKADDLAARGLRIPPVQETDAASYIGKRLSHIAFLNEVVEALFRDYMSLRLSSAFAQETDQMSSWLMASEGNAL